MSETKAGFVVFIGGATGSGKTTLAWRLAREHGFTALASVDYIREALRARSLWPDGRVPVELQESSYVTSDFLTQSQYLVESVGRVAGRMLQKKEMGVIEGVNLVPSQLESLLSGRFQGRHLFVLLTLGLEQTRKERLSTRGPRYLAHAPIIATLGRLLQADAEALRRRAPDVNIVCIDAAGPVAETARETLRRLGRL